MRQLTLNELEDKFRDYISDVEYCEFSDVITKLTQLINFLKHQNISNRILERIESDYSEIKTKLPSDNNNLNWTDKQKITQGLFTPDMQGAFAYFTILSKFNQEDKSTPHYIQLARDWYDRGKDFYEYQRYFNTNFLNPFKDLFLWYIYESKTESTSDYFSYKSRDEIKDQLVDLKEMLLKQGYGQQIIFDEIEELKELTERVNKKNWFELIKGKFIDLALSGVISIETAKKIIEILTGSEMNLLK
ncbi:hypothetical protein ACFSKN_17965 [Mariniflexile gromovii]|uniref:Uncharacterized protein n=1 Tax=Mariniflexile gromovii TaxID=362523 RepID=A0ABS4BX85_9FLAO|nr:hypothetical protein [Mariniflexile gromovii]MBP0905211.1 hypothetical protein [Mariniflexile gromovii]